MEPGTVRIRTVTYGRYGAPKEVRNAPGGQDTLPIALSVGGGNGAIFFLPCSGRLGGPGGANRQSWPLSIVIDWVRAIN